MPLRQVQYKYFDLLMAGFVTTLLITDTVASKLLAPVAGLSLNGGALLIPVNYILGDVFTEVYGYARSRRVIWTGFAAAAFMSVFYWLVDSIPPAPTWPHQAAYDAVLGVVPRIVAASLSAYFLGEFANSFVLAKMKVLTRGRFLWSRTIGSTVVGQALDTLVFVVVAFSGTQAFGVLASLAASIYVVKVLIEVIATPITYVIVNFLKRAEQEDYYDVTTDFNPFAAILGAGNRRSDPYEPSAAPADR